MLSINISKTMGHKTSDFRLEVNFRIGDMGKTAVFFGPSGSGKTLTMRCLAGLVRPDKGLIDVYGKIFFDSDKKICVSPQRRHIGYMPQDYALFPHMNLEENVAYARSGFFSSFIGKAEKVRATALLEKVGLAGMESRIPSELSGGQRQRAALARALNAEPELLLLDEPFSALDPLLREHLRNELHGILETLGIPAVIISHDPDDVEIFAGTLVLYEGGRALVVESFAKERSKFKSAADCLRYLQAGNSDRQPVLALN